jgi:hypothetical protein
MHDATEANKLRKRMAENKEQVEAIHQWWERAGQGPESDIDMLKLTLLKCPRASRLKKYYSFANFMNDSFKITNEDLVATLWDFVTSEIYHTTIAHRAQEGEGGAPAFGVWAPDRAPSVPFEATGAGSFIDTQLKQLREESTIRAITDEDVATLPRNTGRSRVPTPPALSGAGAKANARGERGGRAPISGATADGSTSSPSTVKSRSNSPAATRHSEVSKCRAELGKIAELQLILATQKRENDGYVASYRTYNVSFKGWHSDHQHSCLTQLDCTACTHTILAHLGHPIPNQLPFL